MRYGIPPWGLAVLSRSPSGRILSLVLVFVCLSSHERNVFLMFL